MINTFLRILQGTIIPLQALVHMEWHLTSEQQPQDDVNLCGPVIPVMSVLNHYMKIIETESTDTLAYKPAMNAVDLPESDDKIWGKSRFVGWLCSPGR